ncbi:MAG: hypothetical protein PHT88_01185 [Candidatus Moranbacteria bacterium]|nr:hypothetical protein [Candidatus Moranbacteria bacterium]
MSGNHKQFSYAALAALCVFFSGIFTANAALKDSDVDGITDEAETNTYLTDPKQYDTDGDGFDDGYEIVNGARPLDAKNHPFVSDQDGSSIPKAVTLSRVIWAFVIFSGMIGCFFLIDSIRASRKLSKIDK